ncbi:xanthine dehydrogenase YagR molybdenum-binding subunit [Silvibacterium bohemicum]|uniref:Xanthine dehydrogenase YagR molybdenum-binding subunit n=1 Tax=Silvibacterium bohemicum TaxID=1577686 RepID=A0A841JTF0_9BACT|nr:xanthine dehydrogenase family protein molybdopterin-binding subunit [Silvibacterium bohemicum]MBB6144682.1 xanthine dehydrogenase YagR molybdenum-binding subunit [Silvibacterium bohemicum]
MQEITESKIIGVSTPRVDGPLKVSGIAKYASDHHFPGLLYAWPVCATIANGTVTNLNLSEAEKMSGVVAIYHRANIGPLYRVPPATGFSLILDEKRPPLEDDVVRYYGQYVAVVVAQTVEQARAAAESVRVTYSRQKPDVSEKLLGSPLTTEKPDQKSKRGDAASALQSAQVKVDEIYTIPVETHNPIELHASVAVYDGQKYTLYETSQAVVNHRDVLAQMLGVPTEQVQVITRFLGSGFGGKLWPWPQSILAAACSRNLERPVKLVVSRQMMFQSVGHRPAIDQRIQLAATPDGKLTAVGQDYVNHTSILDDYDEGCGEITPFIYSTPNLLVTGGLARRNVGNPTAMRGPGAVPGLYALESAMDELAIALKMDPVALRLKNEPEVDESLEIPFSSRHMKECLTVGAEKFGWSSRTPEIGSIKQDGVTLGWGVAACSWLAARTETEATVELRQDGSARVACGTQDIGGGTYTVLAQVVSHETGIPVNKIEVVLGDSALPPGPISGGSWVTASVTPSVLEAAQNATKSVLLAAVKSDGSPFKDKKPDDLEFIDGTIRLKGQSASTVPMSEILRIARVKSVSGSGKSQGTFGEAKPKYSFHSYGAQFVEITWQPEIARLRVSRVVTVIDAGRIINPAPARNQIEGAVVMGVGMAMFEETMYDPRSGAPINNNLADYVMAVNADSPKIDVTFLDYPDYKLNALGVRGVGEIGLAGIAAAITNAVYHATGVRVRNLPIRIEDLLAPKSLSVA